MKVIIRNVEDYRDPETGILYPGGKQAFIVCPACSERSDVHALWISGSGHPVWGFNGDVNRPTFTPSLLVTTGIFAEPTFKDPPEIPPTRCHSFIKDGFIQYLSDCTHAMKNQTVELPEWDPEKAKYYEN